MDHGPRYIVENKEELCRWDTKAVWNKVIEEIGVTQYACSCARLYRARPLFSTWQVWAGDMRATRIITWLMQRYTAWRNAFESSGLECLITSRRKGIRRDVISMRLVVASTLANTCVRACVKTNSTSQKIPGTSHNVHYLSKQLWVPA